MEPQHHLSSSLLVLHLSAVLPHHPCASSHFVLFFLPAVLSTKKINLREWSMAGELSLRRTRQADKPRKSCGRKKRWENEFARWRKEQRWRPRLTMSVLMRTRSSLAHGKPVGVDGFSFEMLKCFAMMCFSKYKKELLREDI